MRPLLFVLFFIPAVWLTCPPLNAGAATCATLLTDDQGIVLSAKNITEKLIPASTLKIFTSLAALKTLGTDYQHPIWYFYNRDTGDLSLKGFGNPLFISEEIRRLCQIIIREESPSTIRDIILDHRFFTPDIHIPGTQTSLNPYDATTGALCANFNTVSFGWDNKNKRFISAEPQTPLMANFESLIEATGLKRGRILLPTELRDIYAGLLLQAFFQEKGITTTGLVKTGNFNAPESSKRIFLSNFTTSDMVTKLLYYSNNYIANQLMLIMGAHRYGPPATLEKGMRHLNQFAAESLKNDEFQLVEASGLSRQNRLSPSQMIAVLRAFIPYYKLLRKKGNDYYKTGTLNDVKTRAGFLLGEDKRLYPYVIMLNNTRTGYGKILKKLKQKVRAAARKQP